MVVEGLITLSSRFSPKETADRLAAAVAGHGIALVARVDHAAAAAKVGLDLRPTEVLIFGNPAAGTLLMQDVQVIGLDLPLKVLVWQDDTGGTSVSYQDFGWLTKRYGLTPAALPTVEKMASLLKAVVEEAAR
jgi:uncharacterized protein (DUF302 family)